MCVFTVTHVLTSKQQNVDRKPAKVRSVLSGRAPAVRASRPVCPQTCPVSASMPCCHTKKPGQRPAIRSLLPLQHLWAASGFMFMYFRESPSHGLLSPRKENFVKEVTQTVAPMQPSERRPLPRGSLQTQDPARPPRRHRGEPLCLDFNVHNSKSTSRLLCSLLSLHSSPLL